MTRSHPAAQVVRFARRLGSILRAARSDTGGGAAVALAISLPAVAGLAFLAVDVGRYYNLHTSLQSAADAFALAAAAELDRRQDSIERADRAIAELVANDHRFGAGPAHLTSADIAVRYLRVLPQSDADPIQSVHETTDPQRARYAEVRIRPVALDNPTIASVLGMVGPFETRATSVGGFEQGVCEVAPLFICNPFEGTGISIFTAANDPQWRRRLIAVRSNLQNGPGNYGFLATGKTGADFLRSVLAIDRPPLCFTQDGVETEPGSNTGPVQQGLNTRFGIYDGPMGKFRNDPAYRPARSIRPFPRDDCFDEGVCDVPGIGSSDRLGNGMWDFEGYWEAHHDGAFLQNEAGEEFYSNDNPPSRYRVYQYEVEQAGGLTEHELDRRIFNVAIVDNCLDDPPTGRTTLPVMGYARMFLTEPVGGDDVIWAEMVGLLGPGDRGGRQILRDIVQLHR
jgi:Flp pilus assembly protein TadG